jgi:hypothetical protein
MPEDIIVKVKVDAGDTPETLGNLRKEFIESRNEIYKTVKGTDEYFIALKKAADVKGEITELNRAIRLLNPEEKFKAIATIGEGLVGGFTAASGAITLFGTKNEELEKALRRTQGALALLQGVQAFSRGIKGARAFIGVMGITKKITDAQANSARALGAAQEASAEGTKVATTATKGFGSALKATGIGLLISAIAYLITNFDDVKKAIQNTFPGLGDLGALFDKVKGIVFGFGNAVLKYVVAPFKFIVNLFKGDVKAALNGLVDDLNVVKNFSEGQAKEMENIADEHRKDQIKKETEQTDKLIEVLDARGKDTYKLESENFKKKLSILEKGSKEYEDILQQQAIFEAKNLKTQDDNAKKVQEKREEEAKKHHEKMLQLQTEFKALEAKINKAFDESSAADEYKKKIAEITDEQNEEKKKLDSFLKEKVISQVEYNAELLKLNQSAATQIKAVTDKQAADLKKEQDDAKAKLLKDKEDAIKLQVEAVKTAATQAETILTQQRAKGLISEKKYQADLLASKKVALLQEKAILQANGQDLTEINSKIAEDDLRIAKENEKAQEEISKKKIEVKKAEFQAAAGLLNSAGELLGKNTAAGKAAAIAATSISTFQSAQAAFTGMVTSVPGPVGIGLGIAAAAAAVVGGLARVKAIANIKTPGGAGSSESNPVYTAPAGGSFPITAPSVGQSPTPTTNLSQQSVNQINSNNQGSNNITVAESDITSTQARVTEYSSASTLH